MRNFLILFKILMSVLIITAGALEWIEFESEVSSLEIHHGITAIGLVLLLDGIEKIFQLTKHAKNIIGEQV
jgi:hypothetical protein